MNTTIGEMVLAAWSDGYRLAGGVPDYADDFLAGSRTLQMLHKFPDMHITDGGAWVWFIRSIMLKEGEKRLMPLDRDHFVFVVPFNWVKNEQDLHGLNENVSKAAQQMAGWDGRELSPADKRYN